MNLESQLREKHMELTDCQNRFECEIGEMQQKYQELLNINERLKSQCLDKDRALSALQRIKNGDTIGGIPHNVLMLIYLSFRHRNVDKCRLNESSLWYPLVICYKQ